MPATTSGGRSPYAIEELTVAFHRSRLGMFWRWRTELLLAIVLAAVMCWLRVILGSWMWPLLSLGTVALAVIVLPPARRFVTARFWALFTRHRLQRAFWELRLHTRAGRLPVIAWITATPVGSRALVICRAGLCFEDFEASAARFASACGAREARITCSPRWCWLIWIDIIRRDVLGPGCIVRSPLAALPAADPGPAPAEPGRVAAWPERARTEAG